MSCFRMQCVRATQWCEGKVSWCRTCVLLWLCLGFTTFEGHESPPPCRPPDQRVSVWGTVFEILTSMDIKCFLRQNFSLLTFSKSCGGFLSSMGCQWQTFVQQPQGFPLKLSCVFTTWTLWPCLWLFVTWTVWSKDIFPFYIWAILVSECFYPVYGSLHYTNWIRQAVGHYSSTLATAVQGVNICSILSKIYRVTCLKGNVRLCIQPLFFPEGEEWGRTLGRRAQQSWLGDKRYVSLARYGTLILSVLYLVLLFWGTEVVCLS